MEVLSIPPELQEAVACHMALRTLGFQADDIFLLIVPEKDKFRIGMEVKYIEQSLAFSIGWSDLSKEELTQTWVDLSKAISDHIISDIKLQEIWENSKIHQDRMLLIQNLIVKGMTPWGDSKELPDLASLN